jgi:hypothetical protein
VEHWSLQTRYHCLQGLTDTTFLSPSAELLFDYLNGAHSVFERVTSDVGTNRNSTE